MELITHPTGSYRFLTGIAPFSSGTAALPGYEIVHVTLQQALPYRQGFELIDRHLAGLGRPRQALCAIELRSPKPFTFAGFDQFNQGYQQLLAAWEVLVEGRNPIARTNVAPEVRPPAEPSLYAFSYTIPNSAAETPLTFIIAGAGELIRGDLAPQAIVRAGETSAEAMQEKAAYVMSVMQARLTGLQAGWAGVSAVDIYTVHPIQSFLATTILDQLEQAAAHGVHWFYSRPPIIGLEFEMDMRGVRRELRL
jgi:hypothetical protein